MTIPATAEPAADLGDIRQPLRSLPDLRPLYILPKDPFAEEVLIPGFMSATAVDCMAGFFSSQILASLAPGLATYINGTKGTFRLVISPLLRAEDQSAIESGLRSADDVAKEILEELLITKDAIEQHTLKCLSWLIRKSRIEIKIALMKDALFHPKVWLFHEGENVIAAHGSSNVTYAGIRKNIEHMGISKSWGDLNQKYTTDKFSEQFSQLWRNEDEDCLVVGMPEAIRDELLRNYNSNHEPTEAELHELYKRAAAFSNGQPEEAELIAVSRQHFKIPSWLKYEDGPFEHQGRAVTAWCEAGYQGILEMATGSGKTITAMICAYRLYERQKPLLIVVAAPYVPLIQQWCDEIEPFGLTPINLTTVPGARGRARELNKIKHRFQNGTSDVEVVVVSHKTLSSPVFKAELQKFDCTTLLIADEAHNLGSEGFANDPPSFDYRVGLSALLVLPK